MTIKSDLQIRTLPSRAVDELIECFHRSFADYSLPFPSDRAYWQGRFDKARYRGDLSAGVYEGDQLVAFAWQGRDEWEGQQAVFNTGTGVLPSHRGLALVDQMYDFLLPRFRANDVSLCTLEVLQDNARAIRVYERIGFKISASYISYGGAVSGIDHGFRKIESSLEELSDLMLTRQENYSWDFCAAGISKVDHYDYYQVLDDHDQVIAYYIHNPKNHRIAQVESYGANLKVIMEQIATWHSELHIVNVNEAHGDRRAAMEAVGMKIGVTQYQMSMAI